MAVEPYDEPKINDEDTLIRRVNPVYHVVPDGNTGGKRTSSKLFSLSSQAHYGMSVDILNLIEADGVNAKNFVTTPVYTGSVRFPAKAAREVGLRVGFDPIKDVPGIPDNPYHGEVWGSSDTPKKLTPAQKRALAAASSWFVELQDVKISVD